MQTGSPRFVSYDYLPQESRDIRIEVFVDEQGFEVEFDDIDDRAVHVVGFIGDDAVSTCRFFEEDDGMYWVGRVAVRKAWRGLSLGKMTMGFAESEIVRRGGRTSMVSAQVRASGFYASMGYVPSGGEYLDEYCPHIHMEKTLRP